MKSLSSVGLGLSIVFGCLLLALMAELYYLLWWKKRLTNREIIEDDWSSPAREFLYMFCLKKPRHSQEFCSSVRITDTLVNHDDLDNKDFMFKPFDEHDHQDHDDHTVEEELMRLNSLAGPPRFLFTIIEETKEDLESEDGDKLVVNVEETPYLTPFASPPFFTPPLTPMDSHYSTQISRFNYLFESAADSEFNKRIRSSPSSSSPPPKFKFLQDAEEKLQKRKLMEEQNQDCNSRTGFGKDEEDGPFITIIVDRNKEKDLVMHNQVPQFHSSTGSQVLPLACSPSEARKKVPFSVNLPNG
ncbi:uncharacterized protein LOC126662269 [Mercurialis annua]|uniref:uncharacterized protein LOC126662269 n=1 Tax=Mercurialis annua TaxID=3986 RepID=UPI00215EE054|nr:uncharacterized protein LOC126662269 [Mercurialis annua]